MYNVYNRRRIRLSVSTLKVRPRINKKHDGKSSNALIKDNVDDEFDCKIGLILDDVSSEPADRAYMKSDC